MADQFKLGDVVQLKSGGPKMRVINVDQTAFGGGLKVFCVWFIGDEKREDAFEPEALKVVGN